VVEDKITKRLWYLVAVLLLVGTFSVSKVFAQDKLPNGALIGTWSLVSFESFDATGAMVPSMEGANLKGLLIFTANGVFSLQMISELPKLASKSRLKTTPEEDKVIAHGVLSFFGTYTVSEVDKIVSLHIERSTFANQLRAKELKRLATVRGNELTLQNAGRSAGGRNVVKWMRITWVV
jgi:hypothetical protein